MLHLRILVADAGKPPHEEDFYVVAAAVDEIKPTGEDECLVGLRSGGDVLVKKPAKEIVAKVEAERRSEEVIRANLWWEASKHFGFPGR